MVLYGDMRYMEDMFFVKPGSLFFQIWIRKMCVCVCKILLTSLWLTFSWFEIQDHFQVCCQRVQYLKNTVGSPLFEGFPVSFKGQSPRISLGVTVVCPHRSARLQTNDVPWFGHKQHWICCLGNCLFADRFDMEHVAARSQYSSLSQRNLQFLVWCLFKNKNCCFKTNSSTKLGIS